MARSTDPLLRPLAGIAFERCGSCRGAYAVSLLRYDAETRKQYCKECIKNDSSLSTRVSEQAVATPLVLLEQPPTHGQIIDQSGTLGSDDGYIDLDIKVPQIPNDPPATDRQKAALKAVLTDTLDPNKLTMSQASMLLDVTSYLNGFMLLLKKGGVYSTNSIATEALIRALAIEAVMQDEKLRQEIHDWGRAMYSFGRETRLPDLDPTTKLFQDVMQTVLAHIRVRTGDIKRKP